MKSPIKAIGAKQLAKFLTTYQGTKISSFPKVPMFFSVRQEGKNMFLTRQLLYTDFKEAFAHYQLLAKSCSKVHYYPNMFNVYNKIIVKLYTQKNGEKFVTTKDLFMAYLVNQLQGNQQQVAYRRAIDQFPVIKQE